MKRIITLAYPFLVAGLIVAVSENFHLVAAYEIAFKNFLDRVLFFTAFGSLQTLAWLLIGLIAGAVIGAICRSNWLAGRDRGRFAYIAAVLVAGVLITAYLTITFRALVPARPGPSDWAIAAAVAVIVSAPILAVAIFLGRIKPATSRGTGLAALVFAGLAAVGWFASWVSSGSGNESEIPIPQRQVIPGQMLPAGTNVLLIVVDTLRGDHMSYAGYERQTSPVTDRLAASGVTFSRAIAQATRTSPNTASLLTGLSTFSHGIISARTILDAELLTWGEIFKAAKYQTMAIVANPNVGNDFQFTQGFDEVIELFNTEEGDAASVYRKAIELLENRSDRPFLLCLHPIDPHTPYDPPAPYDEFFYGDIIHAEHVDTHLPFTAADRTGIRPDARVGDITSLGDYIARYDGEIRYADAQLEKLFNTMRRLGVFDNTLIVFTSDHGESLGEHKYFFSHGTYAYEPTAHVPLILAHPNLPAGLVIDELVRTIDVLPSVAGLLGLAVSSEIDGASFLPMLAGSIDPEPRIASINSGRARYVTLAARNARYKLIWTPRVRPAIDQRLAARLSLWPAKFAATHYRHRNYVPALYDLQADPAEEVNVIGALQVAAQRRQLESRLLDWIDGSVERFQAVRPKPQELDPLVRERLKSLGYAQ